MSRIGKKPVPVPSSVTATVSGPEVKMKGPKGELSFTGPEQIKVEKTADGIEVTPRDETKLARSMWGMSRTMIANLIDGVTKGYSHTLEIHGVGFRAAMKGKDQLQLQIGFSHDVVHKIPAGVEVKVGGAKQEIITVSGIDKQTRRPGGRRHPRLAPAGALPGQGHPLSGRVHLPQGRQEEVRTQAMNALTNLFDRRKCPRPPLAEGEFDGPAAPVGAPLVASTSMRR